MGPAQESTRVPWSAFTWEFSDDSFQNSSIEPLNNPRCLKGPLQTTSSNGSWSVAVSWLNDVLFTGRKYTDVPRYAKSAANSDSPATAKGTKLLLRIAIHCRHPQQAL